MTLKISRQAYAEMYGPTVGDRLRLADTNLWIEIEKDHTLYGEEVKFGGGKVIRDGMGQSQRTSKDCPDTVITNAVIVDYWGIVKADIGIKNGRISAIGKAGNPDIQPGINIIIGPGTEIIAGEGMIITAGGIDTHIHFICPQQIEEALMSGVTTMLGGGTGPATGTFATTCTPGPWYMQRMLQAADAFPMNLGFQGKGNASLPAALEEQIKAGAYGLKLHEDWGTTPAAIDNCLAVADKHDVQVTIHTDTLNESGFVETTKAAFKGRTIGTFHTEGAGGGHAPDIITLAGEPNVLQFARGNDAFANLRGTLAGLGGGHLAKFHGRHFDVQVHAIQLRAIEVEHDRQPGPQHRPVVRVGSVQQQLRTREAVLLGDARGDVVGYGAREADQISGDNDGLAAAVVGERQRLREQLVAHDGGGIGPRGIARQPERHGRGDVDARDAGLEVGGAGGRNQDQRGQAHPFHGVNGPFTRNRSARTQPLSGMRASE